MSRGLHLASVLDSKRIAALKRKIEGFNVARIKDQDNAMLLGFCYWAAGRTDLAAEIFRLLIVWSFNGNRDLWYNVVASAQALHLLGERSPQLVDRLEEIRVMREASLVAPENLLALVRGAERNCPPPELNWAYNVGAISVSLATMLYVEALGQARVDGVEFHELRARRLSQLETYLSK